MSEHEAVRIAREELTEHPLGSKRARLAIMARHVLEQHDAREAARASMPAAVRRAADRVEWGPPMVSAEGIEYAAALIAAHEREVAKDATIARMRVEIERLENESVAVAMTLP